MSNILLVPAKESKVVRGVESSDRVAASFDPRVEVVKKRKCEMLKYSNAAD